MSYVPPAVAWARALPNGRRGPNDDRLPSRFPQPERSILGRSRATAPSISPYNLRQIAQSAVRLRPPPPNAL